MDTSEVLAIAEEHLQSLVGTPVDVLTISRPNSSEAAANLAKVISKLSPLVANLIEFSVVEFLNNQTEFDGHGLWVRQDPGFPDTIFEGVDPTPGIEIKAWFPLATEITARFKDSQTHFLKDQTNVALLAWLPEDLIHGVPKIIGVSVVTGLSVATARDDHYHNPPDYLVIEPEDTSARTANLQQTNTAGYKFQGSSEELATAETIVDGWGADGGTYSASAAYQTRLRDLMGRFTYRLDTNFAKIDRIAHSDIEKFKSTVYRMTMHGRTVLDWKRLLNGRDPALLRAALVKDLGIK